MRLPSLLAGLVIGAALGAVGLYAGYRLSDDESPECEYLRGYVEIAIAARSHLDDNAPSLDELDGLLTIKDRACG
jgi:hypothetical protein